MDAVYIFFDNGNIRIPFYNYDKKLFTQLVKSNMGYWEKTDGNYHISSSKYDQEKMKTVLSGKPFVEVGKEPDNPVIVNWFTFGGQPAPEEAETAAMQKTSTVPETSSCLNMQTQENGLSDQFPDHWRDKLETEMRSRKYSPNTRSAYIYHNKALCRRLQKTPEEVTSDDIKHYLAYLEQVKKQSASTLNFALSAFKFFYHQVMKRDTAREQKRPRHDIRLPSVFAKSEIIKILESVRNLKHRIMLMITYDSGLRVSELVKLKRENIDIARKVIIVVSGKGRKDRQTIMSKKVIDTLTLYYSQYKITGWLFPGADPSKHISIRSAQKIFEHAQKKSKIEKNGSIHCLRHTFATHLLERGIDITHIGKLMGHRSIRTTETYTHVARRKTLKITSPLDAIDQEDEDD